MNPFKLIDELIVRDYRIPIFNHRWTPTDDWEPSSLKNNTVELRELLSVIRIEYQRIQNERDHLKAKVKDYEAVLIEYSKQPTRTWTSGSSGVYDPQSGWTGSISGEVDDYKSAREVVKKWSLQ